MLDPVPFDTGFDGIYRSPVGRLGYSLSGNKLIRLAWLLDNSNYDNSRKNDFINEALDRYFNAPDPLPDIPIRFIFGTPFQQRVWHAIHNIPFGEVCTYGELATQLKTGSRAIGQACKKNPIALFVPCHRVIAANGPGGYMGRKKCIGIKQWLLDHESRRNYEQ